MSGVPSIPVPLAPPAAPTPVAAPAAPVAPVAPAAAPVIGTDSLALTGQTASAPPIQVVDSSAMIQDLRLKIATGATAEATTTLYRLAGASLPADAMLPVLYEQLTPGAPTTIALAALDVLRRYPYRDAETASRLQALMSSPDPAVRAAATATQQAITGAPAAPAATATPPAAPASPTPAPGAPAAPTAPSTTATPPPSAAPATADGALSPEEIALIARLTDARTAPAAAVQLAQLPGPRLVAVASRVMQYNTIDGRATDLVVTVLARRRTEPGVAALLREAARKPPAQFPMAVSKAALALAALGDPANVPDMLRMLAVRQGSLVPAKKALIDMVAKNPRLLSQPATEIMLRAVMKERETDALVAAASHALAGIHTAASRDALAASPLFASRDPALRLRALWDLGAHPAPYPPAAVAQLQGLAKDENPQVRSEAAKLLAKSGQRG